MQAYAYAAGPRISPNHLICDPSASYTITSRSVDNLVQTIPTVQLYNQGTTTATLSTSVAITGSVSMSISASISVDESIILASAKQTLGVGAQITLSGTWSTSATVTVTPGHYGYIYGGIFRGVTTGDYQTINSNCAVSNHTVTAKTPYRFGYIADGN